MLELVLVLVSWAGASASGSFGELGQWNSFEVCLVCGSEDWDRSGQQLTYFAQKDPFLSIHSKHPE